MSVLHFPWHVKGNYHTLILTSGEEMFKVTEILVSGGSTLELAFLSPIKPTCTYYFIVSSLELKKDVKLSILPNTVL